MGLTFIWVSRCPGSCLDSEKTAGFYVFADEVDGGFERRSRSEDGRDAVLF